MALSAPQGAALPFLFSAVPASAASPSPLGLRLLAAHAAPLVLFKSSTYVYSCTYKYERAERGLPSGAR